MSQKSIIKEVKASGEEIFQIMSAIEGVCEGVSKESLEIACLALAITLQHPEISVEDRVEGVQDVSRYICCWIDAKLDDNPSVN